MNIGKTMARKAKRASNAAKSYFGFATADYNLNDEGAVQRATDAGQARAKIKRAFER
ncbi:hypothetical protein [Mycolicibacterium sp. lyk4-40-TYG-92]|jgi:uncharacterized protein YjbJ (UPF0337 family)|uniref:hypothetical protein n=1 Tax=Mycolicibacterium sp. lyk4-40-TYG-92 TaxID=3040295 RepID=UPI0025519480|nr:hypothetical protein [Mycolicibacterium sp. lyk4-40-TYG-92]